MDRIARINGKDVFKSARINKKPKSINNHINEDSKGFLINEHQTDDTSIKVQEEYSVINALRDRTVFVNLVVAMFCFAGASFNYYLMMLLQSKTLQEHHLTITLWDSILNI